MLIKLLTARIEGCPLEYIEEKSKASEVTVQKLAFTSGFTLALESRLGSAMMAARWLAVIALAAGCDALFAAKSEPVVELDGETLEAALAAAPVAVVSFGAPWCAHCRRFEPQFL